MKIHLDGKKLHSKEEFYKVINEALGGLVSEMMGEGIKITNLDSLYEVLNSSPEEITMEIANKEELLVDEKGYYGRLMRMLRATESHILVTFDAHIIS